MEGHSRRNLSGSDRKGAICKEWAARQVGVSGEIRDVLQIDTRLRVAIIDVACRQQTVSLRSHIAYREHRIPGQFTGDPEVILGGVLRSEFRLELAKQQNWPERSPIDIAASGGVENAIERVG